MSPKAIRLWLADDKAKLINSFLQIAATDQSMDIDPGSTPTSEGKLIDVYNNFRDAIIG